MLTLTEVRDAIAQQGAEWEAGSSYFTRSTRGSQRRGGGLRLRPGDPAEPSRVERRKRAAKNRDRVPTVGNVPTAFDHRHVGLADDDYTSNVKDQGNCAACVGFGIAATIEATVRRHQQNPGLSIDLAEGQLFFCYGLNPNCNNGLDKLVPVLDAVVQRGVVRESCCPYQQQDCQITCADPNTQLTTVADFEVIDDEDEKRRWISTVGPLITVFEMWEDFPFYRRGKYRHVTGDFLIGHCVSVIGYDDTDGYWICQNSQGQHWGEDGFFRIEYGDSGVDARMWGIVPV